jgi:hypothetical protein
MMTAANKFRLPDAGLIECFDKEGKEITVGPQDELWGQNGCFTVSPMAFTKLNNKGKALEDDATWLDGYRLALDNNTGLVWEVKSPNK